MSEASSKRSRTEAHAAQRTAKTTAVRAPEPSSTCSPCNTKKRSLGDCDSVPAAKMAHMVVAEKAQAPTKPAAKFRKHKGSKAKLPEAAKRRPRRKARAAQCTAETTAVCLSAPSSPSSPCSTKKRSAGDCDCVPEAKRQNIVETRQESVCAREQTKQAAKPTQRKGLRRMDKGERNMCNSAPLHTYNPCTDSVMCAYAHAYAYASASGVPACAEYV